jgi:hypothetical protein
MCCKNTTHAFYFRQPRDQDVSTVHLDHIHQIFIKKNIILQLIQSHV